MKNDYKVSPYKKVEEVSFSILFILESLREDVNKIMISFSRYA